MAWTALIPALLLLAGASPSASSAEPAPYRLEDYLREVRRSNPAYRGLRAAGEGHRASAEAGSRLFEFQAFTDLTYIDDTRDTQAPAIQGEKQIKRNVSAGLRKQTAFGLQLQLSYELNQSSLINANGQLVAHPDFLNSYVNPEFNLSLWQNFLGRADRASARQIEAQARSEAFGKDFEAQLVLVDAEGRYWRLAIARDMERLKRESLERASTLQALDEHKAARHLADRADLLLARSSVKGKELELSEAVDEVRTAARDFNDARGLEAEEVKELLPLPTPEQLLRLPEPAKAASRGDVQSARQGALAAVAGLEVARQRLLPSLSLYGSVFAIGLTLTVPLDLPLASRLNNGYVKEQEAAEHLERRKSLDEDNEWRDLSRKLQEAHERFELARELERIQLEKYEDARKRRARGLTVADQVFQYELDYLNSALNRVRLTGLILGLRARMKLYGEAP